MKLPLAIVALITFLKADSTLSNAVSSKIYVNVPENAKEPFIRVDNFKYQRDDCKNLSIEYIEFDILIYSTKGDYEQAVSVGARVVDLLHNKPQNISIENCTTTHLQMIGSSDTIELDNITKFQKQSYRLELQY